MANSFQQTQQEALALIQKITAEVGKLDAQLTNTASKLSGMFSSTQGGSPDQIKELNDELNRLNTIIGKQQQQITKLTQAKNNYNNSSRAETNEIKSKIPTLRQLTRSQQSVKDAYTKLVAAQKKAKASYRSAIVEFGRSSKEAKKARREYQKYTKQLNEANKATSNFSKTGLGSLVKGFKNLLGAFGVVGAIAMFNKFRKTVFNNFKELDKLEFSLRAVLKNSGELIRTQEFLNRITIQYGAELVSTTERYTKFMVAARNAGLTMKTTEQIFETMTEAAGVMGLKTDELTGIYLALEQMLSKGKVTTEELRRQLGERLPGAFDLAAKAMGVTSSELNDMLKNGEVIASEMLPKLRVEIEKAFGLDSIQKVTTLQAAVTNLKTSWQQLFDAIRTGENTQFVGTTYYLAFEALAQQVRNVADSILGLEEVTRRDTFAALFKLLQDGELVLQDINGQLEDYKKELDAVSKSDKEARGTLRGKVQALEAYLKLIKDEKAELINLIELKKQDKGIDDDRLTADQEFLRLSKLEGYENEKLRGILEELNKEQEETVAWLKARIAQNNKLIDLQKDREPIKILQDENKEYQKQIDNLLGVEKAAKRAKKAKEGEKAIRRGTVDDFDNQISKLREERDAYADTSKEYALYTQLIDNIIEAKNKLIGKTDEETGVIKENTNAWADFIEKMKEWEKIIEQIKGTGAQFREQFETIGGLEFTLSFLGDLADTESELYKFFDSGEAGWEDYFLAISEMAQETFNFLQQASQQQFQREFERLEQEKEIAILFAGESVTAREEIERQYEERRRSIQRRQARAQKQLALFNAIVDTAQAVVAQLAQGGFAAAAAAAILGGVQIALISSTPVPEFFRGTMNAPEGWAKVDEKRPEVHTDRKGNVKSYGESKSNYRYLEAGDKIYKSRELYFEKELGNVLDGNGIIPYALSNMVSPVVNVEKNSNTDVVMELKSLRKAINEKEGNVVNIDKNGFSTYTKSQGVRKERLNNILKLKSKAV